MSTTRRRRSPARSSHASRRRPAAKAARPAVKRRPWSREDLRTLRQLAGRKSVTQIARVLKRSAAGVTFKAFALRVSLRVKR